MTYAAANALDFRAVARELAGNQRIAVSARSNARRSDGSELPPAEVSARLERQGMTAFEAPEFLGATIDREGLNNNYAVVPPVYFATFPTSEQARQYAIQGAAAALFVVSLVVTAAVVS